MEGTIGLSLSDNPFGFLLDSLNGLQSARYLAVASSALLCYEYLITFDQEVRSLSSHLINVPDNVAQQLEYFWSGAWTKTRVLFLVVRSLLCVLHMRQHRKLKSRCRIVIFLRPLWRESWTLSPQPDPSQLTLPSLGWLLFVSTSSHSSPKHKTLLLKT